MNRKRKRAIAYVCVVLIALLAFSAVGANYSFDIDHWIGATPNSAPGILRFVGLSELRSISISLTAAFISILVFLPALVSIAKSQEENLQLTVIERQYVARLGDTSLVLVMSFVGSIFSLLTLLTISYFLVALQAALLSVVLLLTFLKLRKVLFLSQSTTSGFFDGAISELEEEMKEIAEDSELLRSRSKAFEKVIDRLAAREGRIPVIYSFSLPPENRAQVVVPAGKRLKLIDIEPCIGLLNYQLLASEGQGAELDEAIEENGSYRIKLQDPFRNGAAGPSIAVLSIETRSSAEPRIDLNELSNSASQILEKSAKYENKPQLAYEETKRLIVQDFADSLIERDVRRVRRNFDLLDRLLSEAKNAAPSQREALLFSLASDIAQAIYQAGDAFMGENTPRRLILENAYTIIRESARREYWFSIDRFGGAVRSLFRNEIDDENTRSQMPKRVLQSELRRFALMFYELVWILRRKSSIDQDTEAFYAWQMFELFRLVIDWFSDSSEDAIPENVEKLFIDFLGLLGRYFSSPERDILDVRVGGMILLSMQSYALYKLNDMEVARSRKLIHLLFRDFAPIDFPRIASSIYDRNVIDELHWDHWPMEEIGFGGGYVFSASNYYAICASIYWVVNQNRQWLDTLGTSQLESVRRAFESVGENRIAAVLGEDLDEKAQEVAEIIKGRAEAEKRRVVSAKTEPSQESRFLGKVRALLGSAKFISLIDNVTKSTGRSARAATIFTLGMPKAWFIEDFDEFPLERDGPMQRSIERQLFAKFLADVSADVTEIHYENVDIASRGNNIVLTNYPHIGFDPLEEAARKLLDPEKGEMNLHNFRARGLPSGIWVLDISSLEIIANPEACDEGVKMPASLIADLEFIEDKAKMRIKLNGEFRVKPHGKIINVVPPE